MVSDLTVTKNRLTVTDVANRLTVTEVSDGANRVRSDAVAGAGDAALEVEVALGDLAAGIRLARAEVRRMRASAAGWAARGAWGSSHPSVLR